MLLIRSIRTFSCREMTRFVQSHSMKRYIAGSINDNLEFTFVNASTWKNHPKLNHIVHFPTIVVEPTQVHSILNAPHMQPYLASRFELLQHLHTRLKLVRDDDNNNKKLILLHPNFTTTTSTTTSSMPNAIPGPTVAIPFQATQFTANYILTQILPQQVHPPPTSFETIGHVAHLNLKQHHWPYRQLIGSVFLETLSSSSSSSSTVETVIAKVGDVAGPYRIYEFEVVAGKSDTNVQVVEHGIQIKLDIAQVYWCSRLNDERRRLWMECFQEGEVVADAFCGVGAVLLQAAKYKKCTILANDWNPKAIQYLKDNAVRNGVEDRVTANCGDAYDFLMDLGLSCHSGESPRLPDHVILNYPLEAPQFLGALRWWSTKPKRKSDNTRVVVPRVHVYTFARADPETQRSAEEVAVDTIASQLVSEGIYQRHELDRLYDCQVQVHTVRDVAPGKTVFCVSFRATPTLLLAMQGNFC